MINITNINKISNMHEITIGLIFTEFNGENKKPTFSVSISLTTCPVVSIAKLVGVVELLSR